MGMRQGHTFDSCISTETKSIDNETNSYKHDLQQYVSVFLQSKIQASFQLNDLRPSKQIHYQRHQ